MSRPIAKLIELERAGKDFPEHFESEVYEHFQRVAPDDWTSAGEEGCRLLGLFIEEEIERESALDAIVTGTALAGYGAACMMMAKCLGVDWRDLEQVLQQLQDDTSFTGPIDAAELRKMIDAERDDRIAHETRRTAR